MVYRHEQVPLVRVFRARIGRRIAISDNAGDGAMGGGNSAGGSGEELQYTGMEEEEETAVIESVRKIESEFDLARCILQICAFH